MNNSKDSKTMIDAKPRLTVFLCMAATLIAATAGAQLSFTEDFSTTDYLDAANTTADWNTTEGVLKHHPWIPTVVGGIDTPSAARGIDIEGDLAYVADGYSGLRIYDITDPANPVSVGGYDTSGYAYQVDVVGDVAYVADWEHGLDIVNVQYPSGPVLMANVPTDDANLGVAVSGDHAFVADGAGGLRVVDVTNPASPSVAAIAAVNAGSRLDIAGDQVYLAAMAQGLLIFDITDPTNPQQIGSYDTPGETSDVVVSGNLAYLADNDGGLKILDIGDPTAPTLVGEYVIAGETRGIMVDGDWVYLASGGNDLRIFHCQVPAEPELFATVSHAGACYDAAMHGDVAMVTALTAGLVTVQAAEYLTPVYDFDSNVYTDIVDLDFHGDFGYAASANHGLAVITTTPNGWTSTVSTTAVTGEAQCVAAVGDLVYVGTVASGIQIFDISNPGIPVWVGERQGVHARDVVIDGDLAYAAAGNRLSILDLGNPTGPNLAGAVTALPGQAQAVAAAGDVVYLVDDSSALHAVDVSDKWAPFIMDSIAITGAATDLHLAGDLIYVAAADLQVVNVADPYALFIDGSATVSGNARGVAASGDRLFVVNSSENMLTFDLTDADAPSLINSVDLYADAHGVVVADEYAYAANYYAIKVPFRQRRVDRATDRAQSLAHDLEGGFIVRIRTLPSSQAGLELEIRNGTGAFQSYYPLLDWNRLESPSASLRWAATLAHADFPEIDDISFEWRERRASITAIADVPDDQGGRVYLEFLRSGYDHGLEEERPLASYGVYRRVDDPALARLVDDRAADDPTMTGVRSLEHEGTRYVVGGLRDDLPSGTWAHIHSLQALQQDSYLAEIPTLGDSTATDDGRSTYLVTAHTTNPQIWYVSLTAEGHSVDNIAPGVPTGFTADYAAAGVDLDWNDAPEEDFQYHRVYRGTSAGFEPAPENMVAETAASLWNDPMADPWSFHYKVTTLDHAGNESEAAAAGGAVGVPGAVNAFALADAVPNPFNPATTISYTLPVDGRVELTVYDLSGRAVATLVSGHQAAGEHSVRWLGQDSAGNGVASGVYLYRLTAGEFSQIKRATLLK